jgi:hypothetical protein
MVLFGLAAFAENPMVGGAPMLETKDIIDNAVNSADHTTLVAAVKAPASRHPEGAPARTKPSRRFRPVPSKTC